MFMQYPSSHCCTTWSSKRFHLPCLAMSLIVDVLIISVPSVCGCTCQEHWIFSSFSQKLEVRLRPCIQILYLLLMRPGSSLLLFISSYVPDQQPQVYAVAIRCNRGTGMVDFLNSRSSCCLTDHTDRQWRKSLVETTGKSC